MVWLLFAMFMTEANRVIERGYIEGFKFNTKRECISFYTANKGIVDTFIISQITNQLNGARYQLIDVGCMSSKKGIQT